MTAFRRYQPVDGWPAAAVLLGTALMLLIPASLLTLVGINYAAPSGGAWEKVHPGSDLILLGCGAVAFRDRRPWAWAADAFSRFPGSGMFLVTTGFLIFYLMTVVHVPFTPLIDTFVAPVFLFLVLVDLSPAWKARFETLLHVFVAGNALLGLVEFLSGWRLIPAPGPDVAGPLEDTSRAVGLLGHPLSSAAMAGLYAVILMTGGGRRMPPAWRLPALALQLLALAAFGGRTALVMAVICAGVASVVAVLRLLGGRPADPRAVGLGLMLAPFGVAALAGVAGSGFFNTVIERFIDDNGSAKARHAIFELMPFLSWHDLLFGPDPDYLISLQHLVGIEVGIESFWLGFSLTYGLLPSLVFFAALAWFIAEIMRRVTTAAFIPLLFFTVIISSAISLSAKSTMLSQFIVCLVILMPRVAVPRVTRSVRFVPVAS